MAVYERRTGRDRRTGNRQRDKEASYSGPERRQENDRRSGLDRRVKGH